VRADLARDRAQLARTRVSLARERRLVAVLRARLARSRFILARQLVSNYEAARPDLVGVVLESHGFTDLLERIDFLHRAEQQQQTIISATRTAKAQAESAQRRLARLEAADLQIADAAATRARALAGMNTLLQSKQAALRSARAAQQTALEASRATGRHLQTAIARLQAQQAAAQQAAAQRAAAQQAAVQHAPSSPATSTGPTLGPSGGWAIPYAIVLCESGGQNLPPNSAGASGYYQILPSTWKLFGGSGPAAYLASKSEQDSVASRIWNGGAGASNWVCAGIVGIH
jgi:peptidoglycan hydrolase CwlO-like protein